MHTGFRISRGFCLGRSWLALAFLFVAVVVARVGPAFAQDLEDERGPLPTLEITPGNVKAFRTAVLRFRAVGPPVGEERIATLREEIERSLTFSSIVLPLEHDAYLASEDSAELDEEHDFDCDAWKQSGADALLEGEVRREGGRFRADLRVWDVARCKRMKVGRVSGADRDQLETWFAGGGVLVRFAGPRLADGVDELVPVRLRTGGGRAPILSLVPRRPQECSETPPRMAVSPIIVCAYGSAMAYGSYPASHPPP